LPTSPVAQFQPSNDRIPKIAGAVGTATHNRKASDHRGVRINDVAIFRAGNVSRATHPNPRQEPGCRHQSDWSGSIAEAWPRAVGRRGGNRSFLLLMGLAVAAVVAITGGGVWYFFLRGPVSRADLVTAKVEYKDLQLKIVERGTLEAKENRDVKCEVKPAIGVHPRSSGWSITVVGEEG